MNWTFDGWEFDSAKNELRDPTGTGVGLPERESRVLQFLLERAPDPVSRDEIDFELHVVQVEPCITLLRKSLGDSTWIRTHRRSSRYPQGGYSWSGSTDWLFREGGSLPQTVRWAPNDNLPAGIRILAPKDDFIPWEDLKTELERNLLIQIQRDCPGALSVVLKDDVKNGVLIRDRFVRLVDAERKVVGAVWFGGDPDNDWCHDGLVRVGEVLSQSDSNVWQVFQRFDDGSYRRVNL